MHRGAIQRSRCRLAVLFVALLSACSKEVNVAPAVSCTPGLYACEGDVLLVCSTELGDWQEVETCAPGGCVPGASACAKDSGTGVEETGLPDLPDCESCGALEQCFKNQVCVARQVKMPAGYSIDATEVTRRQYEDWLKLGPAVSGQPAYCAWNNSYVPDPDCMGNWHVCDGSGCGAHPQVCVDWCDANAYCTYVGKRLCGDTGSGPASFENLSDPTHNTWFDACSSGGTRDYPYGDSYDQNACNAYDKSPTGCGSGSCTSSGVASLPACQADGAYAGVFDMSGNAMEWADACAGTDGAQDSCRQKGGSFYSYANTARCAGSNAAARSAFTVHLGFRCCSL